MAIERIVVAFSGGLDTTYCAAKLKETSGAQIVTITVDTGGFSREETDLIRRRSAEAGADRHIVIDGREIAFEKVVKYLIQGNVLRGSAYPLCVSAERMVQAELLVHAAREMGADAIAHGSTGAGNDQVRFDVAIRALSPEIKILTPIRDEAPSRSEQTQWLKARGISIPDQTAKYSINSGLWGTTIGGGETHDAWATIPESAYPNVVAPSDAPEDGAELTIEFEEGVPTALCGEKMRGPDLIESLNTLGAKNAVGRGVHIGDTILGIKGRIAFEAPAAMILITAHRELEKLVLSRWQQFWKDKLADFFGQLLHEALFYDPVMKDIGAMIISSQRRVTGEVRVNLCRGIIKVEGARSPFSLMGGAGAVYGESQKLWDGRDARGFCVIYGLQGRLAKSIGEAR